MAGGEAPGLEVFLQEPGLCVICLWTPRLRAQCPAPSGCSVATRGGLDAETKRFRVILAPGFPITLSFPPQ